MSTVQDVMTTDVTTVGRTEAIGRVRDLVRDDRIGMVPVLDTAGRVSGVVTSTDLVPGGASRIEVGTVMSTDVVAVAPTCSVAEAARTMLSHRVHHLVVVDDERLVGVVSSLDLLESLAHAGAHAPASVGSSSGSSAVPSGPGLHASVGDRIVIRAHTVGAHDRRGIITEVRGDHGGPPFVVQWVDDPHEEPHSVMFFPGSDAVVEPTDSAASV